MSAWRKIVVIGLLFFLTGLAIGFWGGTLVETSQLQTSADFLAKVRQQAVMLLQFLLPYAIVLLVSLLVGVSEIMTEFEKEFLDAILTRWGATLLLFNIISAEAVFIGFLVQGNFEDDANQLLLALSVGVGFPTLIRTRFTLKKSSDPEQDDFTFGLDRIYGTFQERIKDGIDRELLPRNRRIVKQLCELYSIRELSTLIQQSLELQSRIPEEKVEQTNTEVDSILKRVENPDDKEAAKSKLAQKFLEIEGRRNVDLELLLRVSDREEQVEQPSQGKNLLDRYTWQELLAQARKRFQDSELIDYIEALAQDEQASEADKKAALADYIVMNGLFSEDISASPSLGTIEEIDPGQ